MGPSDVATFTFVHRDGTESHERRALLGEPFCRQRHRVQVCVGGSLEDVVLFAVLFQ